MKITDLDLTRLEETKQVTIIRSSFGEIAYAIDKVNRVVWMINRRTGTQEEIAAENVHAYAYELMDVADLFLPVRNLWRVG